MKNWHNRQVSAQLWPPRELATLQSANLHEVHDFTESDCEALASMAEQAERRAWRAEEEVASLKAENDDAKQASIF